MKKLPLLLTLVLLSTTLLAQDRDIRFNKEAKWNYLNIDHHGSIGVALTPGILIMSYSHDSLLSVPGTEDTLLYHIYEGTLTYNYWVKGGNNIVTRPIPGLHALRTNGSKLYNRIDDSTEILALDADAKVGDTLGQEIDHLGNIENVLNNSSLILDSAEYGGVYYREFTGKTSLFEDRFYSELYLEQRIVEETADSFDLQWRGNVRWAGASMDSAYFYARAPEHRVENADYYNAFTVCFSTPDISIGFYKDLRYYDNIDSPCTHIVKATDVNEIVKPAPIRVWRSGAHLYLTPTEHDPLDGLLRLYDTQGKLLEEKYMRGGGIQILSVSNKSLLLYQYTDSQGRVKAGKVL